MKPITYDVLGLGVASLDFIGTASVEPEFGSKQPVATWQEMGGGPVATALVALARFGLPVRMAGAVGSDAYGERILADLQQAGVNTDAMQRQPGTSHIAFVLAEPGRDRRTIWWYNDRAVLDGVTVAPEVIASARSLLIDTHIPAAALPAARAMREQGGIVMLDAERVRENTLDLLPLCTAQVVSERFGKAATGEPDPARAAQVLHTQYGRNIAVVTAGERGSWCVSPDDAFHTPAFPVDVVDTTGAGDVFHAGFLYGLLHGWPLRRVARFASAAAALACTGPGGRGNLPTVAAVEQLQQPT